MIGISEFNQEFFDKLDQIENNILNGNNFDAIISEFDLSSKFLKDYKYLDNSSSIEKKIYNLRNNNFDIFEIDENYVIYKIEKLENKDPDINDTQTKKDILELVFQKNKFDYNRKLLEQIKNKKFDESDFLKYGKEKIKSLTLNSIKDNKKF